MRLSASASFARALSLQPDATDAAHAWATCDVPERMAIALARIEDPRWTLRAACIAWRSLLGARTLHPALDEALAALEGWADGEALDVGTVRARLDEVHRERSPAWSMELAMRALTEVVADPHDVARDLQTVAAIEMAVDVAIELDPSADCTATRARVADAIRAAIDPFAALAAETRTFDWPEGEDPIPF